MSSVGGRLRGERESGGLSLEQLSERTGIAARYLQAMEEDDFGALARPAFGKLYIRTYAEHFPFDPAPLIAEYDRAQSLLPESARRFWRWEPPSLPDASEVEERGEE